MVVVNVVNIIALVAFALALCWRLDQIRREGGGLQAIAMTVSIAALTLAFVVSGEDVSAAIETWGFTGAARVVFYALLALGVAGLVVVFFFPDRGLSRERRAGMEAIPLVVALIGLQVTMLVTPLDLRTEAVSVWTVKNVAYGLFFLIASAYLAYGFIACVRSVRQLITLADGYLKTSLTLLIGGFCLLATSSIAQIAFVLGAMFDLARLPWLRDVAQWLAAIGVVIFLIGISYPMLHARWQAVMTRRRRRHAADELWPLWRVLTDAVPEVILPVDGRSTPTERFHRRVVETRDALTQVSPYIPDDFEVVDDAERAEMVRIAAAAYAADGVRSGAVRDLLPGEGIGLDADAAPLLRIARALDASSLASPGV